MAAKQVDGLAVYLRVNSIRLIRSNGQEFDRAGRKVFCASFAVVRKLQQRQVQRGGDNGCPPTPHIYAGIFCC